jgi:uncharacterized protein (TIGR03085 family)
VTSIAAHERTLLCALAQQVGPDAPTLSGDWTVRDLVVHLLVRESSPAAVGLVVKPLSGLVDRAMARHDDDDFGTLVARLRHGPPWWTPYALPKVDAVVNLLEFFIHHEDIRRAQPDWTPRALGARTEQGIWKATRHAGRGLVAKAPVGVAAQRTDTDAGEQVTLRPAPGGGSGTVTILGRPSEVALYVYGRKAQADVELRGDAADVAAFEGTSLGI